MHPDQQYAELEEQPEVREPRVERWRTGEAGRTIWWGQHTLHGIVGTPEIASRICEAMNDVEPLRAALRAIVDEITDDAHEDSEDFDEACESLMKILKLAQDSLRTTSTPPVKP